MAQTLGNGVRYTLKGEWTNGRPVLTIWHALVVPSGLRDTACQAGASVILAAWRNHVVPQLANNYSIQTCAYLDLESENGSTGEWVDPDVEQGGQTATSLSPYNGIVVRKSIAGQGRNRRPGRVFIPGIQALSIGEDGNITQTARDAAVTALEAFRTTVNSSSGGGISSIRLGVAHAPSISVDVVKKVKKPDPDGVLQFSDIVGFDAANIVSGLKRRVDVT